MNEQIGNIIGLTIIVIAIFVFMIKSARKGVRSNSTRIIAASTSGKTSSNLAQEDDAITDYHYTIKSHIMTPKEEDSYRRLVKVFEQKFYVIPQVHLGTLFNHKLKGQNWYGAFQHINRKSVDYVLLNKETLQPVCAVELDDYTHAWKHRQKRDLEVERIFKEAKFPLVRITNITNLSNLEIIDRFAKVINS